MNGNTYYSGAKPSDKDLNFSSDLSFDPKLKLVEESKEMYLQIAFNQNYDQKVKMITTEMLGKAKIPKAKFDNLDGTDLKIDTDYFGKKRSETNPYKFDFRAFLKLPGKYLRYAEELNLER